MTMIQTATSTNYAAAQTVWRTCFGDTKEYTDFLFGRLLRPENVLAWSESDEVKAILCFHPLTLSTPRGEATGAYLFGIATLPERRERGIGTALIEEFERRAPTEGFDLSILVPAGERLFEFYRRRGFETAFYARKAVLRPEDFDNRGHADTLRSIPVEEWSRRRAAFYASRRRFVRWNADWSAYIDAETRALGGGVFALGDAGYVVCYPYKGNLIVKEAAVPDDRLDDLLASLHARYNATEYRLHLPEDARTSFPTTPEPFAMLRWYNPDRRDALRADSGPSPYMAHVLDGPTLGVELCSGEWRVESGE